MFKKRSECKKISQMSATAASLQGRTSQQLPRATQSRDYITPDDAQSACFLYESRILSRPLFPIISSMRPRLSAVLAFAGSFAPHALAAKDSSQPHHDPFSRVCPYDPAFPRFGDSHLKLSSLSAGSDPMK